MLRFEDRSFPWQYNKFNFSFSHCIHRASHVTPQPEDSWIPLLINAVDHCMNRIKELTQNEVESWIFRLIWTLLFIIVTAELWCLLLEWSWDAFWIGREFLSILIKRHNYQSLVIRPNWQLFINHMSMIYFSVLDAKGNYVSFCYSVASQRSLGKLPYSLFNKMCHCQRYILACYWI